MREYQEPKFGNWLDRWLIPIIILTAITAKLATYL